MNATKLVPITTDPEAAAAELNLVLAQTREHQALSRMQLDRDGRVYDPTLKAWVVKVDHFASAGNMETTR